MVMMLMFPEFFSNYRNRFAAKSARLNTRKSNGFTLIELMITIAIIGILAAIVIPSYNAQMRKSRRGDAIRSLTTIAQSLEACRSDTLSYVIPPDAVTPGCTNFNNHPVTGNPPNLSAGSNYTITAQQNAASFLITAIPVAGGPQANDTQCATYTLAHTGLRTALDNTNTPNTINCWR
jgi:type IV pilus assembly protein PilE